MNAQKKLIKELENSIPQHTMVEITKSGYSIVYSVVHGEITIEDLKRFGNGLKLMFPKTIRNILTNGINGMFTKLQLILN